MKRTRGYWPAASAVVVLAGMLLSIGRAYLSSTDGHIVYALDDSYIQMAIAKNLAVHGTWGVTRYEFTGAGTSLLWPWVLAVLEWVVGRHDLMPFVLNVACAAGLVLLADRSLSRHVSSARLRFAVLVMLTVAAPLPVLPFIGMEHTLQCLLALGLAILAARLSTAASAPPWTLVAMSGLLAAATMAVRYDTASVVVAACLVLALSGRARTAATLAFCGALPALAYAVAAARHGRPPVPLSVLMKQRLSDVDMSWHGVLDALGGGGLTVLVDSPAILVLVLVSCGLLLWMRGASDSVNDAATVPRREARTLLWIFVVGTLLHVQFGRLGWLYRYEAYLVAIGIVAIAASLAHVGIARPRSLRPMELLAGVVMFAVAVQPLVLRGGRAWRDVLAAGAATYRHQYRLSMFLQRHPQAAVLIYQAPAYYTDVPIVDVSGLGSWDLWQVSAQEKEDPTAVSRAAARVGARVMVVGTPDGVEAGWLCAGSWTPAGSRSVPDYFYASDSEAVAALQRDLTTFEQEGIARDVVLKVRADGGCPSDAP